MTLAQNPLHLEWKELNKIPKMLRFHWNHFQKEFNVSKLEKLVSHMSLKKLQHKRLVKIVQPELQRLSLKYESSINSLLNLHEEFKTLAGDFTKIFTK